ncbi:hypothetical protein PAXRUDRAFT_823752 [Paxillus rubicundulus Ve08.2h10]|uniref:Uncharacterized protein n=1 Tax=Paxillus rubicundulus Ve08.2h10 TaxID=930991 RepID=A0A0D0E369_9AGAM|nr:hypothetical protein PAXRUDRAFT_823752 [Paxillus rubicundulus Ve08.2h10]
MVVSMSHFEGLDELIQLIYQGFDRFVVLSEINDSAWTVYLGLRGPEGRWWRGSWSTQDVTQLVGPKASSQALEGFADKLSKTFVNGELAIGDWTPDKGARINLTLGPASKRPLHIPLVELSPTEAASHATALLSEIALQAQSRNCHLNPPTLSTPAVGPSRATSVAHVHSSTKRKARAAITAPVTSADEEAQQKIKTLEAELAVAKAAKSKSPEPKASTSARPPKGASLANPHKKARKYQPVEFESDDDQPY